jgi:hypothetical protein
VTALAGVIGPIREWKNDVLIEYLGVVPAEDRSRSCIHPVHNKFVNRLVPCRKCSVCRSIMRRRWFARTMCEVCTAPRAWFVTLTFAVIPADPYREIQLWLKRLRAKTKMPIKYICAKEFGTLRGRLHFHLILTCPVLLTKELLRGRWHVSVGISHAKLVDLSKVAYICNYIGSESERTRASSGWGKGWDNCPIWHPQWNRALPSR